ncbi:MAG: magnesium/cobalt transporter CorA [Gammaproteobacteria bacterium]|nr:magnesium/cobalt transporter CorA [Gammaproteobacteria bacterium]
MSNPFPAPPLIYVGQHQPQETQISLVQEIDQSIIHKNIIDLQQLSNQRSNSDIVSWISVVGLKNLEIINELCNSYSIHPLVIEDILHTEQIAKIDIFDDYLYMVIRVPKTRTHDKSKHNIIFNQVSMIVMKNRLITFQEENDDSFSNIQKQFINYELKTRKLTVDFIVYSLLDAVLDSYFSLADHASEMMETFEDKLIRDPGSLALMEFYKLKRNIMNLRKVVQPTRDVISILSRQGSDHLEEITHVYCNDLYDHCLRISEQLDGYREMLTSMLEIYRSSVNNKLNESMKVLTIIATVFMPLSFLTGIFGMNFNYMPELHWHYGYYMALGLFVVIGVGMLVYFRRKKWM